MTCFAGGCAITHAAMLATFMGSCKFKRFVINDITAMMPAAFEKAVHGGFKGEQRWISREDFHCLKGSDPYVALCFSFGSNCNTYLYGVEIEPYKRACHYAVFFGEFNEFNQLCPEVAEAIFKRLAGIPLSDTKSRRIELGRAVVKELKRLGDYALVESNPLYNSCHRYRDKEKLRGLERLQSLESLESLERLQSLERLERLESYTGDYQDVPITRPGVIYCDPPYKGTDGYVSGDFDYERFYDWCERQDLPVYISEYAMPEDRFVAVWSATKLVKVSAKTTSFATERLFRPRAQLKAGL